MLNNRQQALEKINKMFGTNITVEISEEWKDLTEEEPTEEEPIEEEPTEEEEKDNEKIDNA